MNLGVRKINYRLWVVAFVFLICDWLNYQALAINLTSLISLSTSTNGGNILPSSTMERDEPEQETTTCSEKNIETLTTRLLRDLPAYSNRATQRARRLKRSVDIYSYMLVAGRPEFTPLPLNPAEDNLETSKYTSEGVEQVFFTTLERQYVKGKAVELQQFHWLFLIKSQNGWWMVMMFSQTGSYPKQKPPTPPRDSSNSAVAQAIKSWLRDCRAGSLRENFKK
ncbi:hypothetical protein [Chlorogloeopsis sp. ULAP02]|uniref:hypothetical protein n=1 Tax=Chlorogloeopsis sp. ULAP02 TaxID=3107926 RepID=UPI0031366070